MAAAGNAVADFIAAIGTRQQGIARDWAAKAMYEAWTALVNEQPVRSRPDGTLAGLRALNRDVHLLFAGALTAAATGEPMPASAADTARDLARRAQELRHPYLGRWRSRWAVRSSPTCCGKRPGPGPPSS